MHKKAWIIPCAVAMLLGTASARDQANGQQNRQNDMAGMDMSHHESAIGSDQSDMKDMSMESDSGAHAMHTMEDRHMGMGPHMDMTALRDPKPGDEQRADRVVEAARKVADRYKDYKAALADGYKIFLPNVPQKQYHFTNNRYGFESAFRFNPDRPTSLLYEKHGDDYKLIGVMYTAPKRMDEDDLDKRIPLSIAQWHKHVNFCAPPADQRKEMWSAHPKFGLAGSITTQAECDSAGGKFMPVIFGWMVHVYPFERNPEDIWSVHRQMRDHDHGD